MNGCEYPHLVDGLALRLAKDECHLRKLERIDDIIKLTGSAWVFVQEMTGGLTVEQIAEAVARGQGVELGTIRSDLEELLQELIRREVVRLSEEPVEADRAALHVVAETIRSSVHMDLTHRCNEVCIHCLVPRDKQDMSMEAVRSIIEQSAQLGFVSLSFSGGEPTLHKHFWEILELSEALGFYITVFTNGLPLDEEKIARLAAYQPEQVRISVYSMDAAVHDRITTIPGSHEKTMACVRGLMAHGTRLYINCPVMTLNVEGWREVAAFCDEHKVERNLDPVIQPTRDRTNFYEDLQLTYEQAKEVTGFQQDADELVVNVQPGEPVCNAGDDPSIDASLNLYPCPGLRQPLGNLKENNLEDLLLDNVELERVASLGLDNLEICQRCKVRDGCYRCHGHAFQETGDVTKCARMDRRQASIRRELMVERGTLKD
jgi:radical SAM protein with 4Fe4S-binding SPASM domain